MRLLPLFALLACGGDKDPDSATPLTGVPAGTSTGATTSAPPTHDADIQPIWENHCGGSCHVTDNDGGLLLDDAYDKIVGVPSVDVPTMNLIEPGSLDDSYLWHKIEGTHTAVGGEGLTMPRGVETLPNKKRKKIEAWILDGAPR